MKVEKFSEEFAANAFQHAERRNNGKGDCRFPHSSIRLRVSRRANEIASIDMKTPGDSGKFL